MARMTTVKELATLVNTLNRMTNSPATYNNDNGESNVGHFFIDGSKICRVTSKHGAYRTEHHSRNRREAESYIFGMIAAIRLMQESLDKS